MPATVVANSTLNIANFSKNFIVVDTEGRDLLNEIAIIDHTGILIYEAFVAESATNDATDYNLKPILDILQDFRAIAIGKTIICHNADHDRKILQRTYHSQNQELSPHRWQCTFELAKKAFSGLQSYSLEYLSLYFSLKVRNQYFEADQAHSARYDALFTYQLYLHLIMNPNDLKQLLKPYPNPFASSRVDNPFQSHLDLKSVSQKPYETLKSILTEIAKDQNRQSRGVVITGEAGTGKSHLMMRLAQERLERNRLFFINHPNDPEGVLFHIYSRVLESLIKRVGDTQHTQLEHLLAHFLSKIISRTNIPFPSQKEEEIINILENNPLDIYGNLGSEGSTRKRELWLVILKKTQQWWQFTYEVSGYSLQILTGIIRYCYYTDSNRKILIKRWLAGYELEDKELQAIGLSNENWDSQFNRESLALEALIVFSKLSLLDEPLIIVFDQLESLGLPQNSNLLLSFGQNLKELFTHIKNSLIISIMFPESWQGFRERLDPSITDRQGQFQLSINSPDRATLENLLELHFQHLSFDSDVVFTPAEKEDIFAQKVIRKVINRAADYYRFKRDGIPLPQVSQQLQGKSTSQQILDISQGLLEVSQSVESLAAQLKALLTTETVEAAPQATSVLSPTDHPVEIQANEITVRNPELTVLFDYLTQQKVHLEEDYKTSHHLKIITPSQDRSKLQTILESCREEYGFEIDHLRFGKKKVPENLVLTKANQRFCISFLHEGGLGFTGRMKNLNQLVMANGDTHFSLFRDADAPAVSGKVGKQEIQKFNHCNHTTYVDFGLEHRVVLDLFEQIIIDVQNRDLEIELKLAIAETVSFLPDSWISRLIKGTKPF